MLLLFSDHYPLCISSPRLLVHCSSDSGRTVFAHMPSEHVADEWPTCGEPDGGYCLNTGGSMRTQPEGARRSMPNTINQFNNEKKPETHLLVPVPYKPYCTRITRNRERVPGI